MQVVFNWYFEGFYLLMYPLNKTLTLMLRRLLFFYLTVFIATGLSAQDYRTIDGTGNNTQDNDWGATDAPLRSLTSNGFRDQVSRPGGIDRPNPRIISNELFAQDGFLADRMALSDFTWVFGQFIDHDVILSPNNPTEDASIAVTFRDQFMNPSGLVPAFIPMNRSMGIAGTGTDPSNPRRYFNALTAWIDGSAIYGSDTTRAVWLRSLVDGKLKVSSGNLMPYNTFTLEEDGEIDHDSPEMENENPFIEKLFVAGDVRANENPLLCAFHTIFVREHNRLCDILKAEHPDWDDEQLYLYARKINCGYLQAIVYEEWLPAMGVQLSPYNGYDNTINPGMSNIFVTAAFRLGHTLLNSNILRVDNNGNPIPEGHIVLKDAFFNPSVIPAVGGLDPYIKGMATQVQQEMDSKIIDDVRNFLFGPPGSGAGGLDLASININRGRERGLPDFNTVRENFGLAPYVTCGAICDDTTAAQTLEDLYGTPDKVDPWVGMLAENHMSDALFGETIMKIFEEQFTALRDGDRFYYMNDPILSQAEKIGIQNTTFRDVIMRNTNIDIMQENVFLATDHDVVCSAPSSRLQLNGAVKNEDGESVNNVDISLETYTPDVNQKTTDTTGLFAFDNVLACEEYFIRPIKNDDYRNGVSTADIVRLSKHILELEELDSPYKLIAADVNNSGTITAFDMVDLRKLVLTITDRFPGNPSWKFVDADYEFLDSKRPLDEDFPELININSLEDTTNVEFVAIKIGDVNGTARVNNLSGNKAEDRNGQFTMTVKDQVFGAGELVQVDFYAAQIAEMEGFQFSLDYDESALSLVNIQQKSLQNLQAENFYANEDKGLINASWNGHDKNTEKMALFSIYFQTKTEGRLQELLSFDSSMLPAEAYTKGISIKDLKLEFEVSNNEQSTFVLYDNQPNPFNNQTVIGFELPSASNVNLAVFDLTGKIILTKNMNADSGYNQFEVRKQELSNPGVYYYQLSTDYGSATKKMITIQ